MRVFPSLSDRGYDQDRRNRKRSSMSPRRNSSDSPLNSPISVRIALTIDFCTWRLLPVAGAVPTGWEVVRGVVIPYTRVSVVGGVILARRLDQPKLELVVDNELNKRSGAENRPLGM